VGFKSAVGKGILDGLEAAKRLQRAKEQGYDSRTFAHGTMHDIEEFEVSDIGVHIGTPEQASQRIPKAAIERGIIDNDYGNPLVEGANVLPLRARLGESLEMPDVGAWDDSEKVIAALEDMPEFHGMFDDAWEELGVKDQFEDVADWISSPENREMLEEISTAIQDKGYNSVRYANQVENQYGNLPGLTPEGERLKSEINAEINALRQQASDRNPPVPDDPSNDALMDEWTSRMNKQTPEEQARIDQLASDSMALQDTHTYDNNSYIVLDPSNIRSVNAQFDPTKSGSSKILAGTGAAAIGAGLLSEDAEAGPMGTISKMKGIPTRQAHHGSPHDFDEFSTAKIGTGEGAQAYGHGLYFSNSENIAKFYRDALARTVKKDLSAEDWDSVSAIMKKHGISGDTQTTTDYDFLNEVLTNNELPFDDEQAVIDIMNRAYGKEGKLYRAEIPDESLMLDWDKPLSEQAESIQQGVRNAFADAQQDAANGPNAMDGFITDSTRTARHASAGELDNLDGAALNEMLRKVYGNEASDKFREHGILGITYKGATSNERNFVVFDDEMINLIEKGAIDPRLLAPLAGAGGAGAYAVSEFSEAQSALSASREEIQAMTDDFNRRRAEKRGIWAHLRGLGEFHQGVYESALTMGSGMVGGVVGDLSRISGYMNPYMDPAATEAGAEALQGMIQYEPSPAAIPYLEPLGAGIETFTEDIERGIDQIPLPVRESANAMWDQLPERSKGLIKAVGGIAL